MAVSLKGRWEAREAQEEGWEHREKEAWRSSIMQKPYPRKVWKLKCIPEKQEAGGSPVKLLILHCVRVKTGTLKFYLSSRN